MCALNSGLLNMLVIDRNSVAYFYAVTENSFEPPKAAEGDRKILKLARTLRNLEEVKAYLEDDVRLSMRHLTNNNVVPCRCQQTGLG